MLLLLPHGMFFSLGIALRAIETRGWSKERGAAAAAALAVALVEVIGRGRAHDGAGGVVQPVAIPAALFLAGVLVVAWGPRWRIGGRPARLFQRIGALTYPLYLLNQVPGAAAVAALIAIGCPASAALMLAALGMLALAALISQALEPRLRRALAMLLNRHHAPSPGTQPSASLPTG